MKALRDVLWSERTRDEFPDWAARDTVIIVPIASTEQHGVALPVDTDQRTAEYVSRQAARLADDVSVLVTPMIPFGVSPHHMKHGGTISIGVVTTIAFLGDVCYSIVADGFDRILILSGHGGNGSTIDAAALELKHQLGRQIVGHCWFSLMQEQIDTVTEGPCHTIGHAGEAEASCVLALDPDAVRRDKKGWVEGISDDPALGTAEKGHKILQAGAEAVADLVRHMAALPGKQVVGIQRAKKG